jgi:hypothetical protein
MMNDLSVTLEHDRYTPGQNLFGEVTWSAVDERSQSLSIRLIWFTEGKGDRDYATVDSIDVPLEKDSRGIKFEFFLPHRPLSFSGKIIALKWAVEAVVNPSKRSSLTEFSLVDGDVPIVLADKSGALKEMGMKKPFFSMGSNR